MNVSMIQCTINTCITDIRHQYTLNMLYNLSFGRLYIPVSGQQRPRQSPLPSFIEIAPMGAYFTRLEKEEVREMYYYKIYGLNVASEAPFRKLSPRNEEDMPSVDVTVHIGKVPDEIKSFAADNYGIGCKNDLIWFKNRHALYYVEGRDSIIVEPINDESIGHAMAVVLSFGFAIICLNRNIPAIHCSAVTYQDTGCLIAGYSGMGKSTLTTRVLDAGGTLITDDVAMIEPKDDELIIYPSFPTQNLCRDIVDQWGYDMEELVPIFSDDDREKYVINRGDQFSETPTGLHKMFILSTYPGDEVVLKQVEGADKLTSITRNLFISPMLPYLKVPEALLPKLIQIANMLDIYILLRPESGNTSSEQLKKIESVL